MALFAVDNIYRVWNSEAIESANGLLRSVFLFVQYFLLGVSSVYIAQNLIMLFGFLPDKNHFFNTQYFKDLQVLKKEHIGRYMPHQVHGLHALFCMLFTGTIFGLNLYFHFLPRNLMIWTVFVVFPIGINAYEKAVERNRHAELPDQHTN